MIVLVVGVPGVGKTTLINESMKYIKRKVKYVSVGDVIFEIAKNEYGIENRDEIRKKLSYEKQEELQVKAFRRIKEMENKDEILILDTHFIIESYNGFIPGIIKKLSDILIPDAIAVIIADPDKIFLRRLKDSSIRAREIENLKRIEIQQNMTIYYSLLMMFNYHSVVEIINNEEGLLEEAAKKFAEFINNL